jgi:hypothetical protein
MENSIEMDYVSEKVYHALESGCVPIYYGAPNVADFLPDTASVVNYADFQSPGALLAELEFLSADEARYEKKLAWKSKPLELLPPGRCDHWVNECPDSNNNSNNDSDSGGSHLSDCWQLKGVSGAWRSSRGRPAGNKHGG